VRGGGDCGQVAESQVNMIRSKDQLSFSRLSYPAGSRQELFHGGRGERRKLPGKDKGNAYSNGILAF